MVPGQQFLVDSRFVVETLQEAVGHQLDQVAVSGRVFAQQDQVVVGLFPSRGPFAGRSSCHVDLAADDGLDPVAVGSFVEAHGAEQVAVIGHGRCRHVELRQMLHQGIDFAGAVQQAVIGMEVQVNKVF